MNWQKKPLNQKLIAINCRGNVSQIRLFSAGVSHFFWQQSAVDSLQVDSFFIGEGRRIRKAVKAIMDITMNRMVNLLLNGVGFFQE